MGARFAGSQRLGDRRRRRLAVETEELSEIAEASNRLRAPAGKTRIPDEAHADQRPGDSVRIDALPIAAVVPRQWWHYLIGAMACLLVAGGLILGGIRITASTHAAGGAMASLFALPQGRIAGWFSSLLLILAAQLALLIWWVRSQSLKDFDGHYRLWIRVAFLWTAVSLGTATNGPEAIQQVVQSCCGSKAGGYSHLGWLIPALLASLWVFWTVAAEMRGCLWSRWLLRVSVACHTAAAAVYLEPYQAVPADARDLWLAILILAGHVGIFLSMWLHARHVIYCTSEPAARRPSSWRIPRPHFGMPAMRLPRSRRRNRPTTKPEPVATEPSPHVGEAPQPAARHSIEKPPPIAPVELSTLVPEHGAESSAEVDPAQAQDVETREPAKPDLRGLSKKQRRRVLQELRDRERAAGQ